MISGRLKPLILLISITTLALLLRFYHLPSNPPGIYWDEVSNGYNAYSILKTAKDEYGKFMPTVFRSYDDYKPPGYIYALVPTIDLFGLNEFAVRFPSAIGGVLSAVLIYFICKESLKNEKVALISAFLLAITPWHLQFSRGGFEANFMLFLTLLAIFFFLKSDKHKWMIIAASFCFGIALETYQGAKIWIPLIILVLVLSYPKKVLSYGKKMVLPIIIFILFALPIILNFNVNLLRGKSVSIFSQNDKNIYETFTSNYLSHFSLTFLFNRGDSIGRHSPPGIGELYVFEIPFLLIGLFIIAKNKFRSKTFLVGYLLTAPITASLATPVPHALRAIPLVAIITIIIAIGVERFIKLGLPYVLKVTCFLLLFVIGLYNFILYLHVYYIHYPKQNGPDWQEGYSTALKYIAPIYNNYDHVIISDALGKPYVYTLFYLKFDPVKYQAQSEDKSRFDKVIFTQSPKEGETTGKTLFITSPYQGYQNHLLKEVYASNGDLVFRISDNQ